MPRVGWVVLIVAAVLVGSSCWRQHRSVGFVVDVARTPESCGYSSTVRVVALGNHMVRIGAEPEILVADVAPRLHEILSLRAEKLVYIRAEGDVRWSEFVEVVDRVWPETTAVSLITPQVAVQATHSICIAPSCGSCVKLRRGR